MRGVLNRMKTVAFLLWEHLAMQAKEAEMSSTVTEVKEKCEVLGKEIEDTKAESERQRVEMETTMAQKKKEYAYEKGVKQLSSILSLNQRRALTQAFNRWNTTVASMKKEEEVTELKDAQREKEVSDLKKTHEGEVTELKKTHESEMSDLKKTHEGEVTELKKNHEGEVTELKKTHEGEVTEIKQEHLKVVTEMNAQHAEGT